MGRGNRLEGAGIWRAQVFGGRRYLEGAGPAPLRAV